MALRAACACIFARTCRWLRNRQVRVRRRLFCSVSWEHVRAETGWDPPPWREKPFQDNRLDGAARDLHVVIFFGPFTVHATHIKQKTCLDLRRY